MIFFLLYTNYLHPCVIYHVLNLIEMIQKYQKVCKNFINQINKRYKKAFEIEKMHESNYDKVLHYKININV